MNRAEVVENVLYVPAAVAMLRDMARTALEERICNLEELVTTRNAQEEERIRQLEGLVVARTSHFDERVHQIEQLLADRIAQGKERKNTSFGRIGCR